tara:strand:- start:394369 stop:394620 length:252 start_codon:yes stop_codon:yes gene_type:complete
MTSLSQNHFLNTELTTGHPPALKLVGEMELTECPQCGGVGRIACPQTVAVRTIGFNGVATLQPSTGHPIPCPGCHGSKQVPGS